LALSKGFIATAETGMLSIATRRTTSSPLLVFENAELPIRQIDVQRTRIIVAYKYEYQKLSGSKFFQRPDFMPKL
jgi:hypothetical protein